MNFDPHKYFLKFPMSQLTAAAPPTKLCLEFSSGDTVAIEMKDIGKRRIPSRDLSNSNFLPSFYFASYFLSSSDTSSFKSTAPISSLDQSVLM